MIADIQAAARRLFDVIDAPRGVVGVLAWPDITHPSIRVFVVPGFRLPVSALPTKFEGFSVEIEIRGDVIPLCQVYVANADVVRLRATHERPQLAAKRPCRKDLEAYLTRPQRDV